MQLTKHTRLTPKQKAKIKAKYVKWYRKIQRRIRSKSDRGVGSFRMSFKYNPAAKGSKHNEERIEEIASKYNYEVQDIYFKQNKMICWFSQVFLICDL